MIMRRCIPKFHPGLRTYIPKPEQNHEKYNNTQDSDYNFLFSEKYNTKRFCYGAAVVFGTSIISNTIFEVLISVADTEKIDTSPKAVVQHIKSTSAISLATGLFFYNIPYAVGLLTFACVTCYGCNMYIDHCNKLEYKNPDKLIF